MRISQHIAASRPAIYAAFMSPEALRAWLPPTGMHGTIERFDREHGYRMTLAYDNAEMPGKTADNRDVVDVRFVELVENEKIVQAIDFATADAAFGGTMTMTWLFADALGGTTVTIEVANQPAGISDADHELGIRSSLDNLARFVGSP